MIPETPQKDPREVAREALRAHNENYRRAAQQRVTLAVLARRHGITNQQIGDAYGMTESAVRALIKRGVK